MFYSKSFHGYFAHCTGKVVKQINSDNISDVRFHSGMLFCVSRVGGKSNIMIQVYDPFTGQRIRLIHSPCMCNNTKYHTLHVGRENISLACRDTYTIHTMTHTGELLQFMKNDGYPYLCHTGSDAVLVADWWNNRLKLQNERKWSHVLLEPLPLRPRDAVYISGALFVLSEQELCYKHSKGNFAIRKDGIIKYVCK